MPNQSKVIAFDVDQASLISLRKGLPDSMIDVVNGATAVSLTRDWNPGTVDLLVVKASRAYQAVSTRSYFPVLHPPRPDRELFSVEGELPTGARGPRT